MLNAPISMEAAIIQFCSQRMQFHADELRSYVRAFCHVAPASPDRILRKLRKAKVLNYIVTNRRASTYELVPVCE